MKKRIFSKTLTAVLSMITSVFIMLSLSDTIIIRADGGPVLIIGTVEIDENTVPPDRYIKVPIRVENNSGFNSISFTVQADSRLKTDRLRLAQVEAHDIDGVGNNIHNSDLNIMTIFSTTMNADWYYGNEELISLNFELPENYRSGDFFPIDFLENDEYNAATFSVPDGILNYHEISGGIVSGGIRITGTDPPEEPAHVPEPEPEPEPSAPDPVPQTEAPQATTSAEITSLTSASVSSSASSSVSSSAVPENTVTTPVSSDTLAETAATEPVTEETTFVTSVSSENDQKKSSLSPAMPAVIISAVIISAALYIIINKRRKSNEK